MQAIQGRIVKIERLTDRISEFRLEAANGAALPAFDPGAHIRVRLPDGDSRAYSLIRFDDSESGAYRFAVQREPEGAGGSRFVHSLGNGAEIEISAPKTDFPVNLEAEAVFLAGGIGITPIISMAAALDAAGRRFALHYAARSREVMAYRDRLAGRFGARLHLHFDDEPANALNLDTLIAELGDTAHLYICGPRGLIDATIARAEAAGIPRSRVHVELFEEQAGTTGDSAFEVELASTGQVFTVAPGQSIIDALEAGGVDVLYDCRRGDCGICQCEVLDGVPDHRDVVLSDEERASGKVMQICVSRAKTPRLVLDI